MAFKWALLDRSHVSVMFVTFMAKMRHFDFTTFYLFIYLLIYLL